MDNSLEIVCEEEMNRERIGRKFFKRKMEYGM